MKYDNTDVHLRYDESRKLPDETIALWMDALVKYVNTQNLEKIIDIGCGTGRFLNALENSFFGLIYGIDPSIKMVSTALQSSTSPRKVFAQCAAEYLCINANVFDLAFLSQVYHHFFDKHKALSEIHRILKKKGFLCIRNSTVENLDSCLYLNFFPGVFEKDQKLLSSRSAMKNLLETTGFHIIGHDIIHQKFAENHAQYYNKIKLRGLTDLLLLSDDDFNAGLQNLETYCKKNATDEPIYEEMDLFVCKKRKCSCINE